MPILADLVHAKQFLEDRLRTVSHLSFWEIQHFPGPQQIVFPPDSPLPRGMNFRAFFQLIILSITP